MRFQSGKFEGKTAEEVLLKFPDWAAWNVSNHPDAKHSQEFKKLSGKFNAKPFTVPCQGECGATACGERLPTINLAHVDLTGGKQRPEQHGGGVCRRQHGLGLDPSPELFVQSLDCIRGAYAAPLARRQAGESEQAFSRLIQAVGNSAMLEPPFADEGLTADLYLL